MNKNTWNDALKTFPDSQLLQTYEWGEVKAEYGWTPYYKTWNKEGRVVAMALILERAIRLPGPFTDLRMHYLPKGPILLDWEDVDIRKLVINHLKAFAKERGAFLLKIEPDVLLGMGEPNTEDAVEGLVGVHFTEELKTEKWRYSKEQIQFKHTVKIDLETDLDEIIARMKQKTRYNIRLAERKGVSIRHGNQDDFELLFKTYAETAVRDGFTIRNKDYYFSVWNIYFKAGMLTPLIAEVEGELVAGLMLFHFGSTAWYLYGMSRPVHRNKMPTYLLQWEAIKVAKAQGCNIYDLWGAPEVFDDTDSLWGVYRFKSGLGGQVARHIGAWDLPLRPWIYRLYSQALPRLLSLMRRRGDRQTQEEVL